MNKQQKKKLEDVIETLDTIIDEEQEKLDNMYDSFSETQRYEYMEEVRDILENSKNELQEIIDNSMS